MKTNKSQSGSIHLAIIIPVAIIIAVGLGFIFWQRYSLSKNEVEKANDKTTIKLKDDNSKTKMNNISEQRTSNSQLEITDGLFDTGLTVKYPVDWSQEETIADADSYVSEISSPDEKATVTFSVFSVGPFGFEGPGFTSKLLYIYKDEVPGYPQSKFLSIFDYKCYEGDSIAPRYDYYVGIGRPAEVDSITLNIGDSQSDYIFGPLGKFVILKDLGDAKKLYVQLNARFSDLSVDGEIAQVEIDEFIKSENYKTAKQIIQSLYVK